MYEILRFVLVFIVLLVPLMIIHELGHFWGAKAAGVRVEEFGLGLPPRAVTLFTRGETAYTLNWLPFGAFVRMTGEDNPDDPRSLAAAPKRWRLITLFGGPLMNFIGGFVIFALAYLVFATRPTEYQYRVMTVLPGSNAQKLGVLPGDAITAVNGVAMLQHVTYSAATDSAGDVDSLSSAPLRAQVSASLGKPLTLDVLRPEDPANPASAATALPLKGVLPADANPQAPLGVTLGLEVLRAERVPFSAAQAFTRAGQDMTRIFTGIVTFPIELIRRSQQGQSMETARPVSVVGITNMGVNMIERRDTEGLFPFIWFAGFISIVLGASNLLPLPALDGGRILFVLIEALRGKPVNPVRQQWVHAVGLMVLLTLSAVIMILDVVRPVIPAR